MRGALLVAGTSSDAGKSVVVAGICRWLSRVGVSVAPFKAQNMSLNSVVTLDGAEIGRAQAAQAAAAGVAPEAAMNPVLLKPAGEMSSQVVVMGRAIGDADARSYQELRGEILPTVLDALESLRQRFEVVVCEGAGSLAEINLREADLVNMGLARAAHLPVILVADIDRGGAFASLFGSLTLLERDDQALVAGFVLNKFRGDPELLTPALERLSELTGRPFLGVLPWTHGLGVDAEDSLALGGARQSHPALGKDELSVAVIRLPRISNFTDLDPLAAEPGVKVSFTDSPGDVIRADVAVLPGTKATVEDLTWLRSRGLDDALKVRAVRGDPIVGICGGYQMLGMQITDQVESGAGEVAALGLLPAETVFAPDKVLANRTGSAPGFEGSEVTGYEIRHGRVRRVGGEPLFATSEGDEGCRIGTVLGISWHGIFEGDAFRRAFLLWAAEVRGLDWAAGSRPFSEVREAQLDLLGDFVGRHLDTRMLSRLIEGGAPAGLPFVAPGIVPGGLAEGSTSRATSRYRATPFGPHGDRMVPEGSLDFAVNVVPGGAPPWLREELTAAALDGGSTYPDESEAIRAISDRHGREPGEVLPTNGASEAFWLLATALRPQHAVVVHPAFTESESALTAMGHSVERLFRRREDFSLDVDAVAQDADLVVVGNPNNPTGNLERAPVLARLAQAGRVLVVDEAFMDFSPGEPESLAARSDLPGLVVVRSLTKVWSIPGLRAGYLLGPAEIVEALRGVRQPWSVNTLACAAIVACVGDEATQRKIAEEVGVAREMLIDRLAELPGVQVWASAANFVLIRVPDGPGVRSALLDRGVAVRSAGSFPGLDGGYLRLAVRTSEDNELLLSALREVLG